MNTLSVLVISHNQKEQLRRCLESVLSQDLPFEFEIVISDDASVDGTWELALEYAENYDNIKAFQCDSSECNPTITPERSGYNRSNAYSHSSGKYFVHIDGDDFYRPGTDCLKRQVDLLEMHPECSMCMQNDWWWNEGDPLEIGSSTHQPHQYKTGQIVSVDEFFRQSIVMNSAVMVIRRNVEKDPSMLYHKWYDDSIITEHHLQYGPIVCLDQADWIYSQSPTTSTSVIKANDRMLLWGLDYTVFSALLIPRLQNYFYMGEYPLVLMLDAVRVILSKAELSSEIVAFCSQFNDSFIFRIAEKKHLSAFERCRLIIVREYIKFLLRHSSCRHPFCTSVLHRLCV